MYTGIYCVNAYVKETEIKGVKYSNSILVCLVYDNKAGGNHITPKEYRGKTGDINIAGVESIEGLIGHEIMLQTDTKVYDGQVRESIKTVMLLPKPMGSDISIFIEGEEV